jgi:transposase
VPTIETFAAGPEQDGVAVRAALTTRWSKGRAEGHITHLNLITRTISGRASFDLLRHRVLLAA